MTNAGTILAAIGAFALGAVVALAGERYVFRHHDQRDAMQTVGSFKDWRMNCAPRTDAKGVCVLEQAIVQKGTSNIVAELTVAPKNGHDLLTVVTPLGVLVPAGVRVVVGRASIDKIPYKTCLQMGCIASIPVDSTLAAAMTHNPGGKVIMATVQGKAVGMNFSLKGYDEALAARATDTNARN